MAADFATLERRLKALENNRGAILRWGTVTEVDAANGSARVKIGDADGLVSAPLRVLQQRTLKDKHQELPDIGEQVCCLFAGQGFEQGIVLGAVYSGKDASPGRPPHVWYRKFEDGTELEYDREKHALVADVKGSANLEADGPVIVHAKKEAALVSETSVLLKAPAIHLAGQMTMTGAGGQAGRGDMYGTYRIFEGNVMAKGDVLARGDVMSLGDIAAQGVSLTNHVHDATGKPVQDAGILAMTESSVMPAGEAGQGLNEEERLRATLTDPKDKLIMCLPKIAAAEARRESGVDRQGWLYLEALMRKWRSKPAYAISDGEAGKFDNGGQEPYMVEWDWLMQYARFRWAVEGLLHRAVYNANGEEVREDYLFSPRACAKLVSILRDCDDHDGCKEAWQRGGKFDHSLLSRDKLRRHAFQGNDMVLPGVIPGETLGPDGWQASEEKSKPDGMQASIGKVTVFALATGEIKIFGNERRITVHRVSAFIHDGFEFSGDQWPSLGWWRCDADYTGFDFEEGTRLRNVDFRNFRQRTGFGCDFRVMCTPHLVWEEGFSYYAS